MLSSVGPLITLIITARTRNNVASQVVILLRTLPAFCPPRTELAALDVDAGGSEPTLDLGDED